MLKRTAQNVSVAYLDCLLYIIEEFAYSVGFSN